MATSPGATSTVTPPGQRTRRLVRPQVPDIAGRFGIDPDLGPVDLDVVHAPFGELTHVLMLVVLGSRHGRAAGAGPGVRVERVLKPSLVDGIAEAT
ncbi:MAG: hypothetical protein A2V45_01900 [Candidatus Aminicenantes bacterium RBG_19FT_COMBO_58_17]|nr:MAG: hypothetical protein A2V45_01900 [Candidatus Aminicenantes bacterium RBG_19FT_COMBO_58_17]